MESSGTPASGSGTAPPPPPPTTSHDDGKAGGGWRALAVVLALVLAFGAAVMIVLALNPDDTPRCEQFLSGEVVGGGECYDITETQQLIQNIFAIPAGIIGAAAALLALFFAATGRQGRLLVRLTGVALVLGVGAVIVGQV
jgi:membrane-associated PAP2 superfamily phosphatase